MKVLIKNRVESQFSTGMNTTISIDGVDISGVTKLSYTVDANSMGILSLEMAGDIEIQAGLATVESKSVAPIPCSECGTPHLALLIKGELYVCWDCHYGTKKEDDS